MQEMKVVEILSQQNLKLLKDIEKKIYKVKNNFFTKINSVINFYEKNKEKILLINDYKIRKFIDLNFFIKVYIDFLLSFQDLSSGNIGYGNRTWKCFVKYLKRNYDFDLDLNKEKINLSKRRWTEKNKEGRIDENSIYEAKKEEIKIKNDFGYWI